MNFFKAVSSYNQERFHSEVLCWLMNTNVDFAKSWIIDCCENIEIEDIEIVKCYSEIKQVDILIAYKIKADAHWYWIHVENKIKANEGDASVSRVSKLLNGISLNFEFYYSVINRNLSQTEYYYLRVCSKIEKGEAFGFYNEEMETDFKSLRIEEVCKYWTFIYLRPVNQEEYRNIVINWNINEIINPWIIKDYSEVAKLLESTLPSDGQRSVYEKDYLELVKTELSPFKLMDLLHFNRISSKVVDAYLSDELNISDGILLLDAFKYTSKILKEKLDLVGSNDQFPTEVNFITDTGNNNGILVEFFFKVKLKTSSKLTSNKHNMDLVRIGFQYEQNEPKKGRLKYYFAAYNYDDVKISNKKIDDLSTPGNKERHSTTIKDFYRDSVKKFLFESFGYDYLLTLITSEQNISFNGNKTKTFCSLSIPMPDYRNEDEFCRIFFCVFEDFYKKSFENLKIQINQLQNEFMKL
ncbi:MAG: hypothetical protein ACON5K_02000 [Bacteroidia bacterium]